MMLSLASCVLADEVPLQTCLLTDCHDCAGQGGADSTTSQRSGLHQLQQQWLQQRDAGRTGPAPASEPPVAAHDGGWTERGASVGALAKKANVSTAAAPEGSPSGKAGWAASAPDTDASAAAGAAAQLPGTPPGDDGELAFQLDIDFGPETQLPVGNLAVQKVMDHAATQQHQHGSAARPGCPGAAARHPPGSSLTAQSAERPATAQHQHQHQQQGLTGHQGHAAEAAAAPETQEGSHSAAAGEALPTRGAEACASPGCLQVGGLCSCHPALQLTSSCLTWQFEQQIAQRQGRQ